MKRKRSSEDLQNCDLILTDANGRSVRAHRALLMDRSEYFGRLLNEHDLKELQLDENYLVELIHFLYSQESEFSDQDLGQLTARLPGEISACGRKTSTESENQKDNKNISEQESIESSPESTDSGITSPIDTSLIAGDLEVLMHLLVLAKKYSFKQLHDTLLSEINYRLDPKTAISVYKCAGELGLPEFRGQARMMILSWLPHLRDRQDFATLSREEIYDIFNAESPDIECNSKLDALSIWWSNNKHVNLTDLWAKIMMSSEGNK